MLTSFVKPPFDFTPFWPKGYNRKASMLGKTFIPILYTLTGCESIWRKLYSLESESHAYMCVLLFAALTSKKIW